MPQGSRCIAYQGEVLGLIDSCGGKTVDVQEDDAAGPGWADYCYYATKPKHAEQAGQTTR